MSSKFAETNRTAGPPLVPTQIDERASKKLEGRISLWASKAAANERNSSITERRFSLHINRRSHQSLHGPTPSQDAIDEERAEPYPGDEEQLLKEEEPTGDDEQVVFTSEFHEEMYILVHSHAWVLFILCVVLVNTAALILLAAINIKARAGRSTFNRLIINVIEYLKISCSALNQRPFLNAAGASSTCSA